MNQKFCFQCKLVLPEPSFKDACQVCANCLHVNGIGNFGMGEPNSNSTILPNSRGLKTGLRFKYKERKYAVVGQVQYLLKGGIRNYFYVLDATNLGFWITESVGDLYFQSADFREEVKTDDVNKWKPYSLVKGKLNEYRVQWIDQAIMVKMAGDLPAEEWLGKGTLLFQLFETEQPSVKLGIIGHFLSKPMQWVNEKVEPKEIEFISGNWPGFSPHVEWDLLPKEVVQCVICKTNVEILFPNHMVSYFCPACHTPGLLHGIEGLSFNQKKKQGFKSALVIGQSGKLKETPYLVCGALRKKDCKYGVCWTEYILFNPEKGIVGLTEYKGNWNLVEEREDLIKYFENRYSFTHQEKMYSLFNKGNYETIGFQGFFPWLADFDADGDSVEFINPPELFITERTANKAAVYMGTWLSKKEIQAAFQVSSHFPEQLEFGSNQPVVGGEYYHELKWWTLFVILLLSLLYLFSTVFALNQLVFIERYSSLERVDTVSGLDPVVVMTNSPQNGVVYTPVFRKLDTLKKYPERQMISKIITPTFELKDEIDNVCFDIQSPLSNSWLELNLILTNENTGEDYEFVVPLENYSGYSDGVYWEEGSKEDQIILSNVPGGSYHLTIFPSAEDYKPCEFTIQVTRDVVLTSNYFLVLLGLFVPLAFVKIRMVWFEHQRWMESDYGD